MANTKLPSANMIIVADRAGVLIKQRKSYPVAVQANGDRVLIGFLPAGYKLDIGLCRTFVLGADIAAQTFDICIGTGAVDWDGDANVLVDNLAVTADTAVNGTVFSTFALGETLGVSSANRPVYLLWSAAPATAEGTIHVDLAYFATGT